MSFGFVLLIKMVLLEKLSMSNFNVTILADSVSPCGNRITTFQLKFWRPLLAEINTHRSFSRNASSSRAQSFEKRIDQVLNDTALPSHWNAEQPGMSGGEEFDQKTKDFINLKIRQLAGLTAGFLEEVNHEVKTKTGKEIHKQYLNRYLEPFTYTNQVLTATDWDNFFKLRMAEDAQPEFKDLATEIFYQLDEHIPTATGIHLPYITEEELNEYGLDTCKKIAVARCARVSYRPYGGKYLIEKDLELYQRLWMSGHYSPFEHVAVADRNGGRFFNLKGWRSLRYGLESDYLSARRL